VNSLIRDEDRRLPATVSTETTRTGEGLDRQEAPWPGRSNLVFGWTLLERKHPQRTTAEISFRLGEALDRTPACLKQIHSADLHVIEPDTTISLVNLPRADGIVTRRRDLLIGVGVADCVPVFLTFPGGIAVLHAGWRGVVGGIVSRTLDYVAARWDINPDQLEVLIGPSIGPCCFEVSTAVAALFAPQHRRSHGGCLYIDLPGALMTQWLRGGGRPEQFMRADRCTVCGSPKLHSYRRDRTPGRNLAYLYFTDPER